MKYQKFGPIEITRGCPFGCGFCQTPQLLGGKPRHRSVKGICQYVQAMKSRGLADFRAITPNALSYGSHDGKELDLQKVEELLSGVRQVLGPEGRIFFGSFPSEVRPEHVTEESLEVLTRYADNDNLIIGAESGSQRILDLCRRGHTVHDAYRAIWLTLNAGLKANVDFIFGLPGEDREDVELTIEFMQELARMGARIHAHVFMPLPQTSFAKGVLRPVQPQLLQEIERRLSSGSIYGDWKQQYQDSLRIIEYLRRGKGA